MKPLSKKAQITEDHIYKENPKNKKKYLFENQVMLYCRIKTPILNLSIDKMNQKTNLYERTFHKITKYIRVGYWGKTSLCFKVSLI